MYLETKKLPKRYSGQKVKKKSKYNNVWTEYNGRKYQSKAEAEYSKTLDWRKKAGELKKIEYQFRVELKNEGVHICYYDLDFRITEPDGTMTLVEVKGVELPLWKSKWKLIKSQWKDVDADKLILVKREGKNLKTIEAFPDQNLTSP